MAISFKYRPEKLKHLGTIETLDEKHQKKVNEFDRRDEMIREKKREIKNAEQRLREIEKDMSNITFEEIRERAKLKELIEKNHREISEIKSNANELDYYSRTHELLISYYGLSDGEHSDNDNDNDNDNNNENHDNHDNNEEYNENDEDEIDKPGNIIEISDKLAELNLLSQSKRKHKKPTKKRARKVEKKQDANILNFFGGLSDNTFNMENKETPVNETTNNPQEINKKPNMEKMVSNKASLLDEYMTIVDTTYISKKARLYSIKICEKCNIEMVIVASEGGYLCTKCSDLVPILTESELPNHKDNLMEKPRYPYKRLNHLQEYLIVSIIMTLMKVLKYLMF
jgi:hypothetical protein